MNRVLARVIRMGFCAMIRSPACSIMAVIAPVRLRSVASGLMMEKVRSIVIVMVFVTGEWEM